MPFQYTRTVQTFTEKNTYRCITPFLLLGGTQFLPPNVDGLIFVIWRVRMPSSPGLSISWYTLR